MVSIAVDVTHRNQIAAALAEASAREKAILASIPDIIVEVNNNKEYTWSNRAGFDFFGDELLGKKAEYYFEGEQEPYDLANPLFGKDDSVIYVENWQRRRDGEKRLLAWWRQALKDTDGHVIGALSTARDITDRKRTEEQLRAAHDELEARVAERTTELLGANTSLRREIADREHAEESARLAAAMMNHMADGVQLTRAETGEIVFANPRFEEMFGYGPGELNGKPVSILNAPSEKSPEDTAAEIIQSLGQTGKWSGEVCNIRKNGEHFWCAAAVSTFDHATHGTVWVAVHQDVTERKRAVDDLRASEQHLRNILNGIFAFVGVYALDGVLIDANDAPLRAAGLERSDVIGKPFWETYWWCYSPKVQQDLQDALGRAARGEVVRYDVAVRVG